MSGHCAKPVNFKSNLTGYDYTYLTKVVGHTTQLTGNCLLSAVILSSVYVNLIVRFCTAACMYVSGTCMNISATFLSLNIVHIF